MISLTRGSVIPTLSRRHSICMPIPLQILNQSSNACYKNTFAILNQSGNDFYKDTFVMLNQCLSLLVLLAYWTCSGIIRSVNVRRNSENMLANVYIQLQTVRRKPFKKHKT